MAQSSWAQQATDRFFSCRKSPSQMQCDEIAQSISGASTVRPVGSPGSMSYTVICSGRPGPQEDLIVSFREPAAMLDEETVRLAKEIHGDLVPESTCHGNVAGADPPLSIYSMPYLRGSSCIEVLAFQVEMDPDEEAKHGVFVKHLARYFARCWSSSRSVDGQTRAEKQEGIRKRLARLAEELPSSILPDSMLSKLIENLPSLFSQDYPQVLTHGDFSVTNILVDENKFEITGIIDWSLAAVMPFGMDLDILFLTTGFMTRDGWHDYACKPLLQDTFWEEFWAVPGIEGEELRGRTQGLAEAAGQIGAILRLAFRRNADGSPSEEVLMSESRMKQLRAWFGEQAARLT
ncbi:kinase-like domain-containing protein [Durotheca rogersii]|uniref:kinase-like domain-containing protein n=1 Tax=Durotheca rogersii TaxID=419775 RepID=UPI00221E4059|nr:kinase-like domain-containing protein [Durotheca rogersii]KAI5864082.1 kinase-like domain-containing protein [Durotheca rogersii]